MLSPKILLPVSQYIPHVLYAIQESKCVWFHPWPQSIVIQMTETESYDDIMNKQGCD